MTSVGLVALLVSIAFSPALQADRRQAPDTGLRLATVKGPANKVVDLIWSERIVPGATLLTTKDQLQGLTGYLNYRFAGVSAGSLVILRKGSLQLQGEKSAPDRGAFDFTLYVERAEDGAFYFVPEEIMGLGALRIARDPASPGTFLVAFERRAAK